MPIARRFTSIHRLRDISSARYYVESLLTVMRVGSSASSGTTQLFMVWNRGFEIYRIHTYTSITYAQLLCVLLENPTNPSLQHPHIRKKFPWLTKGGVFTWWRVRLMIDGLLAQIQRRRSSRGSPVMAWGHEFNVISPTAYFVNRGEGKQKYNY